MAILVVKEKSPRVVDVIFPLIYELFSQHGDFMLARGVCAINLFIVIELVFADIKIEFGFNLKFEIDFSCFCLPRRKKLSMATIRENSPPS